MPSDDPRLPTPGEEYVGRLVHLRQNRTQDDEAFTCIEKQGGGFEWVDYIRRRKPPRIITTGNILLDDDVVLLDAVGGAFTATLPDAEASTGRFYYLKRINAGGNDVTIQGGT